MADLCARLFAVNRPVTAPKQTSIELFIKGSTDAELSMAEETRLNLIYRAYLRNLQRASFLYEEGILPESIWNTELAGLSQDISNDQRFRAYWSETRDLYDSEFRNLMEGISSD